MPGFEVVVERAGKHDDKEDKVHRGGDYKKSDYHNLLVLVKGFLWVVFIVCERGYCNVVAEGQ